MGQNKCRTRQNGGQGQMWDKTNVPQDKCRTRQMWDKTNVEQYKCKTRKDVGQD